MLYTPFALMMISLPDIPIELRKRRRNNSNTNGCANSRLHSTYLIMAIAIVTNFITPPSSQYLHRSLLSKQNIHTTIKITDSANTQNLHVDISSHYHAFKSQRPIMD